ncbi:aldehyde dehydrogenase [Peribacillus muralis]|uniref:aldehyde dehydrogenase n=1 Tax=Peribacillus muralis TaxID=264697 RepID=UPI001F4E0114|nr:aldehyde dehydrogenase [Peribacillus muralis]MCK2012829.1 aldehyde dehydrogenase [Peribacillus muralis]
MKRYEAYINGQFTDSEDYMDVTYPATGQIVAQVSSCTKQEAERAVHVAKQAFASWKMVPSYKRAESVMSLLNEMRKEESLTAIATAITEEMGKPLSAAKSEVFYAADLGEYQAQWARRIEGDVVDSDNPNEKIISYKEPLGVVLVIVPWNFPIYVLMRKIIPALISGNTVVVKPSVKSPLSALELARCIHQAGFPQGVINIVTGTDDVVGETLSSSDQINMVTFTGSTKVGKKIMEKASRQMVRTSLELGGKAPAIVMEDADIDLAVQAIKGGRLANSGQVCNNTERVYVHRDIKETFTKKLVEAFQSVRLGDGLIDPDVEMGCLISAQDVSRVHSMVLGAVDEGATILCGGSLVEGLTDSFYPPTLLDQCTQQMNIVHDEIFGPVLPIITFDSLEEVIEMANDSQYGLTANVYSNNYRYVMELTTKLECGEVYVNRQQGEAYQGYHAGWKQSGIGGDDGKHGFEEFLQIKTVYLTF